jgi:enoyl-CoA hydratase/carnithine racemase
VGGCLPEADIGIPFTFGMAALIQSRLAPKSAHEAMVTARRWGGADALAAGIVDHIADEMSLRDKAIGLAAAQAGKATPAVGTIKMRMYAAVVDALRVGHIALG